MCVSVTLIPSLRQKHQTHFTSSHAFLMELAEQIAADAQDMPITIMGEDGCIAVSFGKHAGFGRDDIELF